MSHGSHDDDFYPMPPRLHGADGAVRRVGVELEMANAGIGALAEAVQRLFGGEIEAQTDYEYAVTGTDHGTWQIELDWSFLRKWARAGREPAAPFDDLVELLEDLVRRGSEQFVPYEVVSPPLPMPELESVDRLIAELRALGAQGTSSELRYAFGMQINVELPGLDADTIVSYVKAFACLQDWLKKRADVDLTRRLTAFADLYPADYVRRVVDPDYRPDRSALIADYLAANATRNRALDLLPLFRHLEPDTVVAAVPDDRVKARPALHYRLPDCRIDRPDWDLRPTWADWLVVERLAADREALDDLGRRHLEHARAPLKGMLAGGWLARLDDWLAQWHDR